MGRCALITGANRGLGRRTAELLADQGWRVLVGARRRTAGEETARALRARGGDAAHVTIDVADPDSIGTAARTVREMTEGLDALVNNAGVFLPADLHLSQVDAEVCARTLCVNAVGPLLVTQAFRPLLRAACAACVVNVSSSDARPERATGEHLGYRMSKAALNTLTANLAVALRPENILVNAVEPGWIPTDMGGPDAPDDLDEAARLVARAARLDGAAADAPTGRVFRVGDLEGC
ncbi:SDR family NAD(P)-dependent oxidoreductase [Streptomyces longispororuber]|uniref:SDR family NAD(P)-dependent oxidoreductase n=1 Tax=Streptomyces longispororuber TaxID=68230 RepID=UPI0033C6284C